MTMDKAILNKIEMSVDNLLLRAVRAIVGAGMTPTSAISLVRERLDLIETMAREESHETVADVLVPGVGDERSQAEAWMEATHPEAAARVNSGDGSGQAANPRRDDHQELNQSDYSTSPWPADS